MNTQLALTSSKPIAYRLLDSQLINTLPYAQNNSQLSQTDKNKVKYMIKTQENIMNQQLSLTQSSSLIYHYQDLLPKMPNTPFLNSQKFKNLFEQVQNKQNNKDDKNKTQSLIIPQLQINQPQHQIKKNKKQNKKQSKKPTKINQTQILQNFKKMQRGIISYQINNLREIHLLASDQLTPPGMKALITSLDKQKQTLQKLIDQQKQKIQNENKLRMYQQLQAQQRQRTVEDRIKIMINKRRKPNEYLHQ